MGIDRRVVLSDWWARADVDVRAGTVKQVKCVTCGVWMKPGTLPSHRERVHPASGARPIPARLTCPLCGWKPSSEVWGSLYVLLREHRGLCSPDHGKPAGFDKGGMFR